MPLDWTQIILAMLGGVPATLAAIAAFMQSMRNQSKIDENTRVTKDKADEVTRKAEVAAKVAIVTASKAAEAAAATTEAVADVAKKTDNLNEAINGRMTEKLEMARMEGHSAGILEGAQIRETIHINTSRITTLENAMVDLKTSVGYILEIVRRKDAPKV